MNSKIRHINKGNSKLTYHVLFFSDGLSWLCYLFSFYVIYLVLNNSDILKSFKIVTYVCFGLEFINLIEDDLYLNLVLIYLESDHWHIDVRRDF